MLYETTDKARTFSGEIETENEVVLIDELTCEHIPLEVVKRELNKDIKFCSTRVLTEFLTNLTD